MVLKYALVEADRKFMELEKKVKTNSTAAGAGGASSKTMGAGKIAVGSSRNQAVKKELSMSDA